VTSYLSNANSLTDAGCSGCSTERHGIADGQPLLQPSQVSVPRPIR
jgi:hypothetical protein